MVFIHDTDQCHNGHVIHTSMVAYAAAIAEGPAGTDLWRGYMHIMQLHAYYAAAPQVIIRARHAQ